MVDIDKIFADTLAKYPGAAGTIAYKDALKDIRADYADIDRLIEREGLDKITADYKTYWNNTDDALMNLERKPINYFSTGPTHDEHFFGVAVWVNYNKAVVKYLEGGGRKKQGRPSLPYVFEAIVTETGLQKLLDAGANAKLIEPDKSTPSGYKWIEVDDMKGHHVRAFWQIAIDAGITRKTFKNKEKVSEAIRVYFGMGSLSKDTLSKENPYDDEYKRVKGEMKKYLPANS